MVPSSPPHCPPRTKLPPSRCMSCVFTSIVVPQEEFRTVQNGSDGFRMVLIGSEHFLLVQNGSCRMSATRTRPPRRERSRCTKIQWMGPLLYDAFQSGKGVLEQQRAHQAGRGIHQDLWAPGAIDLLCLICHLCQLKLNVQTFVYLFLRCFWVFVKLS